MGGGGDFERIWKISVGQWFLNAYAVLMCFAPLLNRAIESGGKEIKSILVPIFLVAFGWSFATTLPIITQWIPKSPGLTAYSFMTMIGVYALARALRVAGVEELRMPCWAKVCVFLGCLVCAAIGLGDYNSPFAIGIALLSFYWIKAWQIPIWLGRACVFLAPSMFSVYLIHSHGQAWGYLKIVEEWLLNVHVPLFVAYVLTSAVVMTVCVILDLPRRGITKVIYG